MRRTNTRSLPRYLSFHPPNSTYYYKNPNMIRKANLGRERTRIVSPIRKTDRDARNIEATSVSFPIHPDVQRVIARARETSIRAGRCPFVLHRLPERRTARMKAALATGRLEHPAQVLPEFASKAFAQARAAAMQNSNTFDGISGRALPTIHEIRSLSSHLYARSGFSTTEVQDLMAHTDPDMTRAYQRGHARKVLHVQMMLPSDLLRDRRDGDLDEVREPRAKYRICRVSEFSQNALMSRRHRS